MLNQLAEEVSELLKGKPLVAGTLNILRRMKPKRQVESAHFMLATENYSKSFAKALFVSSNPSDLVGLRTRPIPGLSARMKHMMQREMEDLLKDSKATESYGDDVLSLVVAAGYVSRLIGNKAIDSYLHQNHADILLKFRAIVETASLDHA